MKFFSHFCALLLFCFSTYAGSAEIKLGILKTLGNESESDFLQTTQRYLKKRFDPNQLIVRTFDLPGLEKAIKSEEINFFISNPGFYASIQNKLDTSIIASIRYSNASQPDKSLGSAFLTLKKRDDLTQIDQLKGKVACVVAPNAYGGLYIASGELLKRRLNPENFFDHLVYTGYPMPKVLTYLEENHCDVGIVRTCLLEDFIEKRKIPPDRFRVIEPKEETSGFTCSRSTDLYPGWVIAATKITSNSLKKEVAKELLQMPDVNGNSWTVPENLNAVDNLYRDLKVGHYEYLRDWSWWEFVREYWGLLAVLVFFVLASVSYTRILETQVQRKTVMLRKALKDKEREHNEAERTKRNLVDLEKISVVGMLSSMIAHELRQPLAVIRNYCEGLRTVLEEKQNLSALEEEVFKVLDEQTQKASSIIEHMRLLVKGKEVQKQKIDVREFVSKVVQDFKRLGGDIQPKVKFDLDKNEIANVMMDPVQMEIVVLNLLNNSLEAIHQQNSLPEIQVIVKSKDDSVSICVINEGILQGIESMENIFKIKHSKKESGLGLGLAISARIMESHKGKLIIESKDGKVFAWIKIPKKQKNGV